MATLNNEKQVEIIKSLSEAAELMIDAIKSGRVGFDYAIKEYADQSNNELSTAFKEFIKEMKMGDSQPIYNDGDEVPDLRDERREALRNVAKRIDVPEVSTFVNAMIEAQDKQFSVVKTLQSQSEQLHQKLSTE